MKHEKIDVVEVCKELEDVLAPRLKLPVLDRAVYSHLLRHSRFEGKLRLRFSILWLAHNLGITARRARESVRRLVDKEVLRLVERSNIGHVVEVRSPGEVPAARDGQTGIGSRAKLQGDVNLDELDFMRTPAPSPEATCSATSFPAASTATPGRATSRPRIFCASFSARGACRPRTSADAFAPSRTCPQASCARNFPARRMRQVTRAKEVVLLSRIHWPLRRVHESLSHQPTFETRPNRPVLG